MPSRRIRRSPEVANPVDAFTGLGIPRRAAQAVTDLLRTSVTDVVCVLLPDILDGAGLRWLWSASATFPQIAPLVARQRMPELADRSEQAAALPALWLYPITVELTERFDAVHPDVPLVELLECGLDEESDRPPVPSPALREAHDRYRQGFDRHRRLHLQDRCNHAQERYRQAQSDFCQARDRYRRRHEPATDRSAEVPPADESSLWTSAHAVAQMLRSPQNGEVAASGGWSLLAAVLALDHYREVLPSPGRPRPRLPEQEEDDRSAGQAFELGRALMVATSLVLIAETEPGI
jgi:hypothetical protein